MSPDSSTTQEPDLRALDGWTLHEFPEVTSTNALAAHLPPWSAVRALVQTAGRGRTGRRWVSDENGLWLSAVLPTPGDSAPWSLLPLAAGLAALRVIRDLGLHDARLRWPNDIMIGRRKLAGILVDRFSAEAAVVGIGLNVANHPERTDPSLAGEVACLADLLPDSPPISSLVAKLLASLTSEHHRLESGDAEGLCREINGAWGHRDVQVNLAGGQGAIHGRLDGIDSAGALLLRDPAGELRALPASHVELLREIFPV